MCMVIFIRRIKYGMHAILSSENVRSIQIDGDETHGIVSAQVYQTYASTGFADRKWGRDRAMETSNETTWLLPKSFRGDLHCSLATAVQYLCPGLDCVDKWPIVEMSKCSLQHSTWLRFSRRSYLWLVVLIRLNLQHGQCRCNSCIAFRGIPLTGLDPVPS